MKNIKPLIFTKLLLLIGAIILAGCLVFIDKSPVSAEESTIIIMDVSSGMMTQDISTSKGDFITRLDAAKKIVTKILQTYPQRSFGLITYGSTVEYLIPPTTDSGTLLQYTNSLLAFSSKRKAIERSTGLIATLKDKQLIVLGSVTLPKSLLSQAQKIDISTYQTFTPQDLSTFHFQPSTGQTQWLIIILCLLAILSI